MKSVILSFLLLTSVSYAGAADRIDCKGDGAITFAHVEVTLQPDASGQSLVAVLQVFNEEPVVITDVVRYFHNNFGEATWTYKDNKDFMLVHHMSQGNDLGWVLNFSQQAQSDIPMICKVTPL